MQNGKCCLCDSLDVLPALFGRGIRTGAPLNSDTTLDSLGYTREWAPATYDPYGVTSHAIIVTDADVAAGYHYTTGTPLTETYKRWLTYKLKPYRITLGIATDPPVSTGFPPYRPFLYRHLQQYNAVSWAMTPTQARDIGPPAQGHAGRLIETQPQYLSTMMFYRDMTAPSAPMFINGVGAPPWEWFGYCTHVRFMVDGEDITGPLAVNMGINTYTNSNRYQAAAGPDTVSIPDGIDLTDAVIEIDLWHEITLGGRSTYELDGTDPEGSTWNGGGTAAGWHICSMYNQTFSPNVFSIPSVGGLVFTGGNANRLIPANRTIVLEFDRQAPGGASVLRLEPQSGWTPATVPYDGAITMTHSASSDIVEFVYSQEVPCIAIYRTTANNTPTGYVGYARYYPVDTDHYEPVQVYQNDVTGTVSVDNPVRGIWRPKTATVFRLAGRQKGGFLGTMEIIGSPGSGRDKDSVYYDRFPYEITVSLQ